MNLKLLIVLTALTGLPLQLLYLLHAAAWTKPLYLFTHCRVVKSIPFSDLSYNKHVIVPNGLDGFYKAKTDEWLILCCLVYKVNPSDIKSPYIFKAI